MPLNNNGGRRERIGVMGGAGSGKTRAWLSVAELARKTKSDARFYVIDTDFAVDAMLDGFPKLRDYGSLEVVEVIDYTRFLETAEDFADKAGEGDWVIADLMDKAWDMAQQHYADEVFGKSKAQYFLEVRKTLKKGDSFQGFEGWTDWQIIKPLYYDISNLIFLGHKAHVLVATGSKPLSRTGKAKDSNQIIQAFGHLGFKPEGEKKMPHMLHTVLNLSQKSDDTWVMDTGKDRERDIHRGVLLGPDEGQFVRRYLIDVAGWKLK